MDSKSLNLDMKVQFSTRVIIEDPDNGKVFVDKSNAIHSQNMARAIARGLANEPNSTFYRMAFGNGGSFIDAGQNIQLNPPNDGTRGEGWESRLYNETYSEVIQNFWRNQSPACPSQEPNTFVGEDLGSAGPEGIRIGGGSDAANDEPSNSVISVEVGRRSNIIATVTINRGEPSSQLPPIAGEDTITDNEQDFNFDELGIYTQGQGASNTRAFARIDVENKNSQSLLPTAMLGNTYTLTLDLNGTPYTITNIEIPSSGAVTYGDLCEIINNNPSNNNPSLVKFLISNTDPVSYPSIAGAQTFGFLVVENAIPNVSGSDSTILLECGSSFLNDLLDGCLASDVENVNGQNAGVLNSRANPELERERLLTHITFPPILKKANRQIRVRYILTVSVAQVGDTRVDFPPVVDLTNGL